MRIGFLVRRGNPEGLGLATSLAAGLRGRGIEAVFVGDYGEEPPSGFSSGPGAEVAKDADILVALGGDGTFLYGADWLGSRCPFAWLNLGSLGFLTPYATSEAGAALVDAVEAACVSRKNAAAGDLRTAADAPRATALSTKRSSRSGIWLA